MKLYRTLRDDQTAATTTEYAIMLALIALACIAAIISVGSESGGFWSRSADQVKQVLTP